MNHVSPGEPVLVLVHPGTGPHVDAEQRGHPVEVVGVVGHSQHLGDDGVLSPLWSKLLHQLHEVAGGGLADGVHWNHSDKRPA